MLKFSHEPVPQRKNGIALSAARAGTITAPATITAKLYREITVCACRGVDTPVQYQQVQRKLTQTVLTKHPAPISSPKSEIQIMTHIM